MTMEEVTKKLLKRRGVNRPCCGTCAYWMTELMIGGQYCGWLGSCWNPDSPADRIIEADDWCSHYGNEANVADGADGEDEV